MTSTRRQPQALARCPAILVTWSRPTPGTVRIQARSPWGAGSKRMSGMRTTGGRVRPVHNSRRWRVVSSTSTRPRLRASHIHRDATQATHRRTEASLSVILGRWWRRHHARTSSTSMIAAPSTASHDRIGTHTGTGTCTCVAAAPGHDAAADAFAAGSVGRHGQGHGVAGEHDPVAAVLLLPHPADEAVYLHRHQRDDVLGQTPNRAP